MDINFYENIKNPKVVKDISVQEWFSLIKSSDFSSTIELARSGRLPYEKTKEAIPCVTYNFTFDGYKNTSNVVAPTGIMYIDIDNAGFNISLVDPSMMYAYYKSFGGSGYALIVKVDGINLDNFKQTYISVCSKLGISQFVDCNAIKATQFNALSYDQNIYVNENAFTFQAENENVPSSIVYSKEKEAYTIETGTKQKFSVRFNNLQDMDIAGTHVVNWEGFDFINCWIPMKKRENQHRNNFIISYANNLFWLNPGISFELALSILKSVNEVGLANPYNEKKLVGIINTMFRYSQAGTLKPIYNRKKRKIVFSKNSGMDRESKLKIVRQELVRMKVDNSTTKFNDTLENWDFKTHGKITVRKIAEVSGMNVKTVAKYNPQFKEYIDILNCEFGGKAKKVEAVEEPQEQEPALALSDGFFKRVDAIINPVKVEEQEERIEWDYLKASNRVMYV